eukprot:gb/GECG01016585.1/.p1 GENE.gb/GECG01016585.1/~~gb/GECG01016585.1/.p1  ORF type:complete len:241 (+),score=32.24 gb/GECG01016585.1/:1-723(+)
MIEAFKTKSKMDTKYLSQNTEYWVRCPYVVTPIMVSNFGRCWNIYDQKFMEVERQSNQSYFCGFRVRAPTDSKLGLPDARLNSRIISPEKLMVIAFCNTNLPSVFRPKKMDKSKITHLCNIRFTRSSLEPDGFDEERNERLTALLPHIDEANSPEQQLHHLNATKPQLETESDTKTDDAQSVASTVPQQVETSEKESVTSQANNCSKQLNVKFGSVEISKTVKSQEEYDKIKNDLVKFFL